MCPQRPFACAPQRVPGPEVAVSERCGTSRNENAPVYGAFVRFRERPWTLMDGFVAERATVNPRANARFAKHGTPVLQSVHHLNLGPPEDVDLNPCLPLHLAIGERAHRAWRSAAPPTEDSTRPFGANDVRVDDEG